MSKTKEWTLMFYMASDNPLAISIVSQLKALKAAGFHHQANVIAQFDPFTEGTPTHIFDVNMINKLKYDEPNIGFDDNDTFVRNLIEDKLWRDEKSHDGKRKIREMLDEVMGTNHGIKYTAPVAPDLNGITNAINGGASKFSSEMLSALKHHNGNGNAKAKRRRRREPGPFVSLYKFLDFCQKNYPARHYMLFMLGHGVVVGNDIFLFDEHAETQSITLSEMGIVLRDFKKKLDAQKATFDMVAFHSCSVSSVEVAAELRGTANYMLASQAPSFVGSWPYRNILIRVFKDIQRNGKKTDVKSVLSDIFSYCFHNSTDYLLAGYSYQLTLCNLRKIGDITKPIDTLSNALIKGLEDPGSRFIILYAHWKAQSFFQEMYTDLYDFCYCIADRYNRIVEAGVKPRPQLEAINDACRDVLKVLTKPAHNGDGELSENALIPRAEFIGPAYQYSHGMSIYFPWSRPSEDSQIMQEYERYKFNQRVRRSWADFLTAYFEKTQRKTHNQEQTWDYQLNGKRTGKLTLEYKLQEDIASLVYNGEGPLGGFALTKESVTDRTGEDSACLSFKNYPRDTRSRGERRKSAQAMPVSGTLLGEF